MRTNYLMPVILCVLAACGGDPDGQETPDTETATSTGQAEEPAECLAGNWQMDDNGVMRSFIFRADQTGEERYSEDDIRPFTWERTSKNSVHIVYTAHGDVQSAEYDLSIDCDKNELSYFGAVYKPA